MIIVIGCLILIFTCILALFMVYDACFSGNPKYMGDERSLPEGEQYEPYLDVITRCVDKVLEDSYEKIEIESFDGLKLAGKYYHRKAGAPLILFFHGYRCNSLRDGNGIFLYSKTLNYNILLVDQRVHGLSEGKTITFGINERHDVLSWVDYVRKRFSGEQKIILAGLSMGAATVLMTANMQLPANVKGILADCPYSSPKAILKSVIKSMHYPVGIVYFLAKLGAKWIGGFDVEETSAVEAIADSDIPILIIHGDDDRFVPCNMSRECQRAGKDHVELVVIDGAAHGLSHCVDAKKYEEAVRRFLLRTVGE